MQQIIIKRVVINGEGEIISCELHSPFAYLSAIASDLELDYFVSCGSKQRPLRFVGYVKKIV